MIDGTLDESSYNDDLKSRLFLLRNILNKIDENIENDEVKNLLFFKEQIDHIVKNKFSVENLELLSRLRQQIAIENKISEFFKLTSEIMIENSIPENMSPLIHDIGERDHKIRFMNLANKNVEDFSTSEENYRRYKFLREEIRNTLNVGEYNSLNRSFAVLALGKILSENKVSPEISAMKSYLAKMLLVHYYIGNTQIALGVVEEGIYLANVIRALNTIHTLEKMSVPIFSNIVGGLNSILMIPSIGLAIASLAGSEVTGPLSVPFSGLGFAGQALNSRFAALNHQSLEIAKEFDHLKKE
jgi:hypothetical protein